LASMRSPLHFTHALEIAARGFDSVAVREDCAVVQWGYDWGNVPTNRPTQLRFQRVTRTLWRFGMTGL
jgi:hypothetical protein